MAGWSKHGNAGAVCDIWEAQAVTEKQCGRDGRVPSRQRINAAVCGIADLLRGIGFWLHRGRTRATAESDAVGRSPHLHALGFVVHAAGIRRNRQRPERAVPDVARLRFSRGDWSD